MRGSSTHQLPNLAEILRTMSEAEKRRKKKRKCKIQFDLFLSSASTQQFERWFLTKTEIPSNSKGQNSVSALPTEMKYTEM